MKLKILWPGKTRNKEIIGLQEFYLKRINQLAPCELIQTREAKGIPEKFADRIKEIEASGLEKNIKDDYIICLFDEGKEMSSIDFARFLEKVASNSSRVVTFVVGGFLGLEERILKRADFTLSLSRMTFSHELSRIMILEQIYRSLTIIKGRHYAK
ncbi:MAG: 23S rRNA (pseudouridine(1915)-N(3))-methyltransferase RlmH [Candidatus Aminicenantes bacterium]|nr:23S rRNA (pseudouridine(1915)-N(3))-methyltransferase RlmH [Candidatus Aminicenantes bacterium]